jgi:hypothetical protein
MFRNFLYSKLLFYLAWNTISIELAKYACTQSILENLALDCENSKDVPGNGEEQYYEEPDLSGGVGVDYGIVYGTSDEEPDTEA